MNTHFGDGEFPASDLTRDQLARLALALYYQLNERMSFVNPPDKIVAQLLFDLGNIKLLLGEYVEARIDYEKAKEYGYGGKLLESRYKWVVGMIKKDLPPVDYKPTRPRSYTKEIIAGVVLLVLVGIVVYRFRNRDT